MKIGIFGLWHLGCILAASWSKLNNQVIGFDYDIKNIDQLSKGIPPIFEPDLEKTLKDNLNNGLLKFTSNQNDLNDCDYVFLAYDTPVNEDDNSDTSILTKSIIDLSKILKNQSIVIISSQSPIGFCSKLRDILRKDNSTLELVYSPENLRLGEAIKCYLEPERIILGTNNKETEKRCLKLFNQIQSEIISMNLESAEMVKHGINSFLSMSIVFSNHLADICSEQGAKIQDVIKGIKSDNRIGKKAYLSPGIGFSGGTLGRDLKVLKQANNDGYAKIFESVYNFNLERKYSIIDKIEKKFGSLKEKNIGVIGLTYKPGTSTLRRSLPVEIINIIYEKGAKIKAFDPKADYNELSIINFEIVNSIEEATENIDFLILMTEWPEFKVFDWSTISNLSIFDTKNFLNSEELTKNGIKYYSI